MRNLLSRAFISVMVFLYFTNSVMVFLYFTNDAKRQVSLLASVSSSAAFCDTDSLSEVNNFPRKIDSGWDAMGNKLYHDRVLSLSTMGVINTTVYPPMVPWPSNLSGGFFVSRDECANRNFWGRLANGGWERQTFKIFNKYINPGKTTVVDFGTWIGPTLLYHGGFSKLSFGIEADPVAYAVAEYNVALNRKLNPEWGRRVSVDSACISRPEDVGRMTMKAGVPGESMSGIGDKVYQNPQTLVKWQVQCYSLPDIFENYWNIRRPYKDVFLKIDVESYECKLMPSFYDWLKGEKFLPKFYISFHPQIEMCSDEEFQGVLRFVRLYDRIRVWGGNNLWKPRNDTDLEEVKKVFSADVILYQDRHGIEES